MVMEDATLEDLLDAYEGVHGIFDEQHVLPSGGFLKEMMNRFPDDNAGAIR